MQGPSVATIRSGWAPLDTIFSMVAPITPFCRPRRPQCAAPITPASGSAISTGRQSAANMPSATLFRDVTWPSASMTVGSPSFPVALFSPSVSSSGFFVPDTSNPNGWLMTNDSSTSTASPECTWLIRLIFAPSTSASALRLASTCSGLSPDLPPRLKCAKSPSLVPPSRVV